MRVKIKQGREEINSISGISLVGGLIKSLRSLGNTDKMSLENTKNGFISHSGIPTSFIGLFCLGKTGYADIEPFRRDDFFRDSLGLKAVPSESTLRQRVDELGKNPEVSQSVLAGNVELLKRVRDIGAEKTQYAEYIPLDVDVSTQDNSGSSKEGVSWTYSNHDGYAPIFAYLGTQGYMLNCEQRPGSQHSNKGAIEFMDECFDAIDDLGMKNTITRMDSAHDDAEIVKLHQARGKHFIIKRNLRHELPEQWLAMARRVGDCQTPREGKSIFTGVVSHIAPAGREDLEPLFAVFEVAERTTDKDGQILLLPKIDVNMFWTDLPEPAETIVQALP